MAFRVINPIAFADLDEAVHGLKENTKRVFIMHLMQYPNVLLYKQL